MSTTRAFLTGAAVGAGAAYFLDERQGGRRRAWVGQQVHQMSRQIAHSADAGVRDLRNRAQGAITHPTSVLSHRRKRAWATPGGRLVMGTVGSALMANCLAKRTPASMLLGTLGFGLLMRATSDAPHEGSGFFGWPSVTVHKSIEIAAPAERVYDFFMHPDNYPRVSDVITNVEIYGDGRFSKDMVVAGVPVHFAERFTCCEPNCKIETKSEPDSAISYCKQIRLEEAGDDQTRVHLQFCYAPPGGALGHGLASMFGFDAKTLLADLLMRAKFFLETGREPHDATARRQRRSQARLSHGQAQSHDHHPARLHGSGAPEHDHDVLLGRAHGPSPWPESSAMETESMTPSDRFPPAI